MSARQLQLLVFALAALLLLWGVARLFSHGSDAVGGTLSLPTVSSGTADAVTIAHAGETLHLARTGQVWSVNGHRASPSEVQNLFQSLADTSPREIVAISSTSFGPMGVDSAEGWWLEVSGGGRPLLQLVIGKAGHEPGTGYVRLPSSDTVFLWRGLLPHLIRRPMDEWRDHRIAAVPVDSVRRVDVQRGRSRYSLEGRDGQWFFAPAAGRRADSTKVTAFLDRFRDLTVTRFATPAQADSSYGRPPQRTVALHGPRDSLLVELSFDSTATGFWVRRTGDPNVYWMGSWQANGITPVDTSLRAAPAGKQPTDP